MMRTLREIFVIILVLVISMAGIMTITFVPVYYLSKYSCDSKLTAQQLNGQFGFFTDCMVKLDDGKLVPMDAYNTQTAIQRGTKQ